MIRTFEYFTIASFFYIHYEHEFRKGYVNECIVHIIENTLYCRIIDLSLFTCMDHQVHSRYIVKKLIVFYLNLTTVVTEELSTLLGAWGSPAGRIGRASKLTSKTILTYCFHGGTLLEW